MRDVVAIVGGGLSGLSCALHLDRCGVATEIFESGDSCGGRVATDRFDGFLLDRGLHVFWPGGEEALRIFDYEGLHLRPFSSGVMVRVGGKVRHFVDPLRHPFLALGEMFSPVASFGDLWRFLRLRQRVTHKSVEDILIWPQMSVRDYLRVYGFSETFQRSFFRPFVGGAFFDLSLDTSSRMLEWLLKLMGSGVAALPARGMGALPEQILAMLRHSRVHVGCAVEGLEGRVVGLSSGERVSPLATVVATDGPTGQRLLGQTVSTRSRGGAWLYFAAEVAPYEEAMVVLNGEGFGPVNLFCPVTNVAPSYAEVAGGVLLAVEVVDRSWVYHSDLQRAVVEHLKGWFGGGVASWRFLRQYAVRHALLDMSPSVMDNFLPVRVGEGVYACGELCVGGSVEGALLSGRRAAEAILEDLIR